MARRMPSGASQAPEARLWFPPGPKSHNANTMQDDLGAPGLQMSARPQTAL